MKQILVTGANRGIGLAICQLLSARGDRVNAVCRQPSEALLKLDVCIESGIDVTRADELADLAQRIGDAQLDWAVLNAGVLAKESLGEIDADALTAIRHQFEVNALGPLLCVQALRACFKNSSRIGIITSRMGSLEDNTSGGYYGYRMSKAAVNAAGRSLAMDLREEGVAVFLLHPGFVRTEMTGGNGEVTPEQSAEGLIARMDTLAQSDSGSFWHANGSALPW